VSRSSDEELHRALSIKGAPLEDENSRNMGLQNQGSVKEKNMIFILIDRSTYGFHKVREDMVDSFGFVN